MAATLRHWREGYSLTRAPCLEGVSAAPLLDLNQTGIRGHAAGAAGLLAVGGEHVQAAADLDRFPGDFDELELGARLVGLDDARGHQRRNVRRTDHGAAVVEDLHKFPMADAPGSGVGRIEPQQVKAMLAD